MQNITDISSERIAAVIASPKTAALYYDRILPLPGRSEHIFETDQLLRLPSPRIESMLAESPGGCRELLDLVRSLLAERDREELRGRFQKAGAPTFANIGEQAMYYASCECNIVGSMELVLSELPRPNGLANPRKQSQGKPSVLINLQNLRLVDASTASWDQIIAFREDTDARRAFIRMRDFLFTSCSGLTLSQLQDRIAVLTDDYVTKSKQHGFETRAAAWDVLLNSEVLVKSLCAGALGVAIGHLEPSAMPHAAVTAVAGLSLTFDVSRAAIASKRKLNEGEAVLAQHPLNWVFLAKERFDGPQLEDRERSGILAGLRRLMR